MVAILPTELLQSVIRQCPCREEQIHRLATYYNNVLPSPPLLVASSFDNSSTVKVITKVLQAGNITYVAVRSKDCLSPRHLWSKIFAASVRVTQQNEVIERYDRVDSINALVWNLQRLLKQKPGLHKTGVPYLRFPPFSRAEAVSVVTNAPPALHPVPVPQTLSQSDTEALPRIYAQFVVTVYDSLVGPTCSTSLSAFRSICHKLWPRFIWPLISGDRPPSQAKTWDFAKLLVRNRGLFQADGENSLTDRLCHHQGAWTFEELQKASQSPQPEYGSVPPTPSRRLWNSPSTAPSVATHSVNALANRPPLLKQFTALLLISAYLASHTHPKHDIILFSRLSTSSSKRIRKSPQKKKLFQSLSKRAAPGSDLSKSPIKAAKKIFDTKMDVARPFGLERLVAILRAVHPHGVSHKRGISDRVFRELGELERLRLVVRAGGAAGGEETDKWKVNVGREWVVGMGKLWGMGISDYEMDQE